MKEASAEMSGLFWAREYFRAVKYLQKLKSKGVGVLLVLFVMIGLLIYAKRKPREYFHHNGEIWADQAGYYVYLPGAFIYEFDGSSFQDEFLESVGQGFWVDSLSGKIFTKYAIGVAMMQAPFFGIIHAHTAFTGGSLDGFSGNYHNVPNWAAWFYASLGLWLFFLFLKERVQERIVWLMLAVVFFGTSTYYYTADNTGMSHIYSFFLFSAFIYIFDKVCRNGLKWSTILVLGAICGLIIAVRPVNLLFVPMAVAYLLFLNKRDWRWAKAQISTGKVIGAMLIALFVLAPQFLYWKYTSGSFVHYSYGSEGFSNWKSPMLIEFWFSPLAGLFLYSPAYLVAIIAILRKLEMRENQILIVGFLAFCYLMASWHVYYFGCSLGSRNLVEFSVLFLIPLALWLNEVKAVSFLAGILYASVLFTLSLTQSYNGCYTYGMWNWEEFGNMAARGVYYQCVSNKVVLPANMYEGISSDAHRYFTLSNYDALDIYLKMEGYSSKTELAFEVYKDSVIDFGSLNVSKEMLKDGGEEAYFSFLLPKEYPKDATVKVYLMNLGQDTLKLETLSVWMR